MSIFYLKHRNSIAIIAFEICGLGAIQTEKIEYVLAILVGRLGYRLISEAVDLNQVANLALSEVKLWIK